MNINKDNRNEKYTPALVPGCFSIVQNEKYIFSLQKEGVLFVMDEQQDVVRIGCLGEEPKIRRLYSTSIKVGDEIYFAPWGAHDFWCYDVLKTSIVKVTIEGGKLDDYYELMQYENDTFAIGLQTMQVYQLQKKNKLFAKINNGRKEKRNLSFVKRCNEKNERFFLDQVTNHILAYNITMNEWLEIIPIYNELKLILAVERELWLIDARNTIFVYDRMLGIWKKLDISLDGEVVLLYEVDNFVHVYFKQGNRFLQIDKYTKVVTEKNLEFLDAEMNHYFCEVEKNILLIWAYTQGLGWFLRPEEYYVLMNLKNNDIKKFRLHLKERNEQKEFNNMILQTAWDSVKNNSGVLQEKQELSLFTYLEWLNNVQKMNHLRERDKAGLKIMKTI